MMHKTNVVDPLKSTMAAIIEVFQVSSKVDVEIRGKSAQHRWLFKIYREAWYASLDEREFWSGNTNSEAAERDQVLLRLLDVPGCFIRVNDKGGMAVLNQNPLILGAMVAKELETT